mmetsp:Transcript_36872/g.99192  ORF Transcript_36872/g.99192 Transcript_36872/m.99192 type:complete len:437 (+) Transcript_36872:462-1772(+)
MGKFRFRRDPFGGKRCISDEIPLPLHVANEYDLPCMQPPDRREQLEDPHDPTRAILEMVFKRHDADESGEIEMHEVNAILEENGLTFDSEALDIVFKKFDVDGSGTLDFNEFCEMMADLKAEKAIVEKRSTSYELPASLKVHFTDEEVSEMLVHFGMFDADGGGSIAAEELMQVLQDMGHDATPKQVRDIIKQVDKDQSGEIEFAEFATMMHKVNTGEIEVGGSLLAQAVMDSAAARRLAQEVTALGKDPIEGVRIELMKREADCAECLIEGPSGTPYADRLYRLRVKVGDDYPFAPPKAFFSHRVMHVNFSILLDGTTSMPQVLEYWDAEWDLRTLVQYVKDLLIDPNLSLLPADYAQGTRHDQEAEGFNHSQPRGYDLREKRGSARVLAEVVHLFCDEREKYDMVCRQFANLYGEKIPDDYFDDEHGKTNAGMV